MKIAAIIFGVIIIVLIIVFLLMPKGAQFEDFEYLKDPQISQKADLKMIIVEAKGDPNTTGKEAFGLLFKTYFKMKGVPKGPKQPAPRARWPISAETPMEEWIGYFAMPVPDDITQLPEVKSNLKIKLANWKYGEVAEILHIGSYASEDPTIKRLKDFITEQGYEICGEHEEEYVKGPGMFIKGNPDKYLTIIRYQVKKVKEIIEESTE